jgi:AcrR family transcriptional regulator
VAKTAFADEGADVSLDEIARRAGVGIGTLYRHFPTRDAIVEAVYRREVQQLAGSATRLLGSLSPGEALREWMRLFVDYIATEKVIASTLGSIVGGATELYASSGVQITTAMSLLVKHAVAIGDIRPDVDCTIKR